MKKRMNETIVETQLTDTHGNYVTITQPNQPDNEMSIYLYPEQIDIVIEWLREAKEELTKES
jgi:hypothetical protein